MVSSHELRDMPCTATGAEAGGPILPESSARANTGLSASLEEELQDLERHWEDLDRADAQDTAQAQPTAHGMVSLTLTPCLVTQSTAARKKKTHVRATCQDQKSLG